MKKIVAGVVVAACVLGGGWFWLRDAAVVQVRDVFITGLSSSEAPSIRTALKAAALDMTTLHVREDQLRAAMAEFPSVAGVRADAKFPHKLTIEVRERAPVAAIESGAGRVAAAGDGRVLRGLKVSDLPILRDPDDHIEARRRDSSRPEVAPLRPRRDAELTSLSDNVAVE